MANPYVHDMIDNWVSDFCISDHIRAYPADLQEIADALLRKFLYAACDSRDTEPGDIEEPDIKQAMIGTVALLAIPDHLRAEVPTLCGDFLSYLQDAGRLSSGRVLGAFARALADPYMQAASGKARPVVNAGSKIGRNDPCPCGSGKKYKKCCGGN